MISNSDGRVLSAVVALVGIIAKQLYQITSNKTSKTDLMNRRYERGTGKANNKRI